MESAEQGQPDGMSMDVSQILTLYLIWKKLLVSLETKVNSKTHILKNLISLKSPLWTLKSLFEHFLALGFT